MRILRPAVALAVATCTVALVLPSDAAPRYRSKTLSYSDTADDANAVNGQGIAEIFAEDFPDNVAAGQPVDGYDVVKVTYTSTGVMVKKGKRYYPLCTGFVVRVLLGGAPEKSNTMYRVLATTPNNDGHWWLQYANGAAELRFGHLDPDEPTGTTDESVALAVPAKLTATSITFTVTAKDAKASGEKITSLKMSELSTEVRSKITSPTGGYATVPKWDGTAVDGRTFKPC